MLISHMYISVMARNALNTLKASLPLSNFFVGWQKMAKIKKQIPCDLSRATIPRGPRGIANRGPIRRSYIQFATKNKNNTKMELVV